MKKKNIFFKDRTMYKCDVGKNTITVIDADSGKELFVVSCDIGVIHVLVSTAARSLKHINHCAELANNFHFFMENLNQN